MNKLKNMVTPGEYSLELLNVYHTGPVERGSVFQRVSGSVPSGVILRDVSLTAHSGGLMAVLGSKGSGKRALLEVVSRRAQGPTRGQVLLRRLPMSLRLFQDSCGYASHKTFLLEGLTAWQTLIYAGRLALGWQVSTAMLESRVTQVLADMALMQVTNRYVQHLTASEHRRLAIATQLVKDPLLLLLDEPAWGLDPLNTYLLVSMLSNHATKYGRLILLTMEKPRSDIFPFLERVTYLCLGEVVYTGSTRLMLDYFRGIGFPCPELENPLMYYLCLSTVDRRSRDRFVDSNNQIAALVERFRVEGGPFRKHAPPLETEPQDHKPPLFTYGQPGLLALLVTLVRRSWALTSPTNAVGFQEFFLRFLLLPCYFFLLWNFCYPLQNTQSSYVTRGGLIFNCLAGTSLLSAAVTATTFTRHRTRYYQDCRTGLYRGPTFLLAHLLYSAPVAALSVMSAAAILYFGLDLSNKGDGATPPAEGANWQGWAVFGALLFAVWGSVQQQTVALLLFVRSAYTAACVSVTATIAGLLVGAATLRSLVGSPDWLYAISHLTVLRYSSAALHEQLFLGQLPALPVNASVPCPDNNAEFGCRYRNGTYYLLERYHLPESGLDGGREDLDLWANLAFSYVFYGALLLLNFILYLLPLPAFVKTKFRE